MTGNTATKLQAPAMFAADSELQRLAGPVFSALQHAGLAMAVTDPRRHDNPIVCVNDAFLALTGYSAGELVGRNCRMLQGPATDRHAVAEIAAAVAAGRRVETEILNYRKDGSEFWNRMFVTPVTDPAGAVSFFLSSQLDVTTARAARATAEDLQARQGRLERVNQSLQHVLATSGAAATWEWHIAAGKLFGDAGFAALHGMSAEQAAAGVPPAAFFANIHPQDLGRIRLSVGGMLRGAEIFSKEFRIVTPFGGITWVDGRGRCSYDTMDRPVRFSGVLVDITAQKRLEERLRIAQSAGGVGTFEHVDGFATASVSPQFCRLLGLHPAADLPVRTINDVVHDGHPPIIDTDAGASGAAAQIEFRITRRDTGQARWLMRRGEHLRDEATGASRFSGVIYDITDAKDTEAQLRTLNETLETRVAERTRERDRIWRVSPDLLGVADAQGVWRSINPAWNALLGWDDSEIIGRDSAWLLHPDDGECAARELAGAAAAGRTIAFANRLRHRGGQYRWLSWTAVPEQGLIYCVGRDVTAETETAEALHQAEEKLRQSQKMEAVGQLTGGLAHDFNNLLTGITGSLELMRARMAQGRFKDVDRYVTAAQGAAQRAASLTHRLLAFSRRQTLDPRHTDLNRLVAGMEELIRRTVGPAITVDVVATENLWPSFVDANQVENALLNLCINARDAMPDGGNLTIATANSVLDIAAARACDLPPGDYVKLSVRDTGTGMKPEVMARAFDPFFTTKPLGQGTGLGLSMIYGFARQSGGHVGIVSAVGQGATVSIHLPRYHGASDDAAVSPATRRAPPAGQGETVLVVDDEPTVRMLLTDVLHDLGYTAIEAADGAEGLMVLQSDARIDLLVTDVGLPGGLNGRQVADMGRARRPDLKVLFITGYAEHAVLGTGDLDTGMHVVTKPFAIDVITDRIRQIIIGPNE